MNKLESTLVGVAGEYLVAGELSRRGYIASISLRNSRGIDIIASNSTGNSSISIQVKTNSSGSKQWMLNKKSEDFFSDNHFYIFVILNQPHERPDFYIVPSTVVASTITREHREWLNGTGRGGKPRKDTPIRQFADTNDVYLEKWDLLPI